MSFLQFFNPFSKVFSDNREIVADKEEQLNKNSLATTEDNFVNMQFVDTKAEFTRSLYTSEQSFYDKKTKIAKYREMSEYPEISDSIDNICDEAIVNDSEGNIGKLKILKEIPVNVKKQIEREFNYIQNDVLNLRERGWDLFKKWLIESELYLEKVISKEGNNKRIIGMQVIPAFTIIPHYNGSLVEKYTHTKYSNNTESLIEFEPNQVSYINYGNYGKNVQDTQGYLHPVIKIYNSLRNLEDALIIYRLTRAVEKRVFNIEVGNLPHGKVSEIINKHVNRYKKNLSFDSNTGTVNSNQNIMAMTEDFWFERRNGSGSSVDTLQGGMNLGELTDVSYFLKKLYKTLKLPRSRWEENSGMFNGGKSGEISREEIKFDRFIGRLQNRFKKIIFDFFFEQLAFSGVDPKYINQELYDFEFTKANYFAEYKELELLENKGSILNMLSPYIASDSNPLGLFDKEFLLKKYFGMSEKDYEENQKLIEAKAKLKKVEDLNNMNNNDFIPPIDSFKTPE